MSAAYYLGIHSFFSEFVFRLSADEILLLISCSVGWRRVMKHMCTCVVVRSNNASLISCSLNKKIKKIEYLVNELKKIKYFNTNIDLNQT